MNGVSIHIKLPDGSMKTIEGNIPFDPKRYAMGVDASTILGYLIVELWERVEKLKVDKAESAREGE
jgi:hypothetical protein